MRKMVCGAQGKETVGEKDDVCAQEKMAMKTCMTLSTNRKMMHIDELDGEATNGSNAVNIIMWYCIS